MLSDADLVESSIRIELQHRTTWQRTRQLFFPPTHFRWRGGKQKPQETVTFQGVDIWLRGHATTEDALTFNLDQSMGADQLGQVTVNVVRLT